jgi:hypothetical protein
MMQMHDERSVDELSEVAAPDRTGKPGARRNFSLYTGTARTAPRGSESRIGDDDTHRRLQAARNRARHSIETIVRRELGPEWVKD